jgi:hypothetical protein
MLKAWRIIAADDCRGPRQMRQSPCSILTKPRYFARRFTCHDAAPLAPAPLRARANRCALERRSRSIREPTMRVCLPFCLTVASALGFEPVHNSRPEACRAFAHRRLATGSVGAVASGDDRASRSQPHRRAVKRSHEGDAGAARPSRVHQGCERPMAPLTARAHRQPNGRPTGWPRRPPQAPAKASESLQQPCALC